MNNRQPDGNPHMDIDTESGNDPPQQQQPQHDEERHCIGIDDMEESQSLDIFENDSHTSSSSPLPNETGTSTPDTPKRDNRKLTYEAATQSSDGDDDDKSVEEEEARKRKSLYAVGAAVMIAAGMGYGVVKAVARDDADFDDGGVLVNQHNSILLHGDPTSSIQAVPDMSHITAQLAAAPPPISPAELLAVHQMACQAASNAAGTVASTASSAAGAAAGNSTVGTYVTRSSLSCVKRPFDNGALIH